MSWRDIGPTDVALERLAEGRRTVAQPQPETSGYDMGSRVWFAGEDGMLTDPDFVPAGEHGRCRPVAVDGALVDGERQRLDGVFAAELDGHSAWADAPVWHAA